MRKHQIESKDLLLLIAWLLSLAFYAVLYIYVFAQDRTGWTGFGVTSMYYCMLNGFLFGLLFGAKEGGFWNLKWLLPLVYYAICGMIAFRWLLFGWYLVPAGLTLAGLLMSFSIHKLRNRKYKN